MENHQCSGCVEIYYICKFNAFIKVKIFEAHEVDAVRENLCVFQAFQVVKIMENHLWLWRKYLFIKSIWGSKNWRNIMEAPEVDGVEEAIFVRISSI